MQVGVFFSEHSVIADIGLLEPTYFMTVDQALDLTALMFMALAVSERVSYDYYSSRKRMQQSKKKHKVTFFWILKNVINVKNVK